MFWKKKPADGQAAAGEARPSQAGAPPSGAGEAGDEGEDDK